MCDVWEEKLFEFNSDSVLPGYVTFELYDGRLSIDVCAGAPRAAAGFTLSEERTVEFLTGLQAWIEGLC
jgi:hypothetical protein